jgi:8-oxo-dGTP pyrophosphatase MutT (NUDIX family)
MIADIRLAGAIVVHEECVLIVQRSKNETFLPLAWGVPCGKIEDGEAPRDAVLRELHEETGLQGEVVRYVGLLKFSSERDGRVLHNLQRNYLVRLPHSAGTLPDVNPPEKHQGWQWVHPRDLERTTLDPHNLAAIEQALSAAQPI